MTGRGHAPTSHTLLEELRQEEAEGSPDTPVTPLQAKGTWNPLF